jgi:hypothetical protein
VVGTLVVAVVVIMVLGVVPTAGDGCHFSSRRRGRRARCDLASQVLALPSSVNTWRTTANAALAAGTPP